MIISIVEQIATDMGLPFYHGSTQFQNLIADEQTLPALYLDQPITSEYNLSQSGYTSATYPIKLMFLYKSELDYTTTQHDVNCIQPAEAKIREFINRAELVASIDTITNISSFEFINIFDCNVSGKSLNVTFQINNSYSTCADAGLDLTKGIITNSDTSYNNEVGMGNTLVLADITHIDSDGSEVVKPAMTPFVATTCTGTVIAYQRPALTGQLTSYETYDDAWQLANGIYNYTPPANPIYIAELNTFTTLKNNNAFGNLNRFTDINGLQVYGDGYMIDHYTGLGYYTVIIAGLWYYTALSTIDAGSYAGFTDWRITNLNELKSIIGYNSTNVLDFAPFNNTSTTSVGTNTSFLSPTTNINALYNPLGSFSNYSKNNFAIYYPVRNHYN